jgi:dihydrofolate reductase
MKVSIIAAMTADGFIGQHDDHIATAWTNKEDKYLFTHYVKEANNMVMGYKTFMTTAKKYPRVFNKSMPGRRLLVYTHDPASVAQYENVEAVSEDPGELVKRLKAEGLQALAICGGAQIYTMFMNAGVVDDLYIDMQATVFGTGVSLFSAPLETSISLKEIERLGDNNVLLHYTVRKA